MRIIEIDNAYAIQNENGSIVGFFKTRELAEKKLDKLNHEAGKGFYYSYNCLTGQYVADKKPSGKGWSELQFMKYEDADYFDFA